MTLRTLMFGAALAAMSTIPAVADSGNSKLIQLAQATKPYVCMTDEGNGRFRPCDAGCSVPTFAPRASSILWRDQWTIGQATPAILSSEHVPASGRLETRFSRGIAFGCLEFRFEIIAGAIELPFGSIKSLIAHSKHYTTFLSGHWHRN